MHKTKKHPPRLRLLFQQATPGDTSRGTLLLYIGKSEVGARYEGERRGEVTSSKAEFAKKR